MYIIIVILFVLGLFCFILAEVMEDTGCLPAIIGLVLVLASLGLLIWKVRSDRQSTIDYIYGEGYKRGQIFCINKDMVFQKKLNRENEYIYQKVKEIPSAQNYLKKDLSLNLYQVDSIFTRGFKRGQIDCIKGIIKYERFTNDDGEVIFRKLD